MTKTPNLLNDDGSASMATMLLLSHHAFRRDIMRFQQALEKIINGDHSHDNEIKNEWETSYRAALHGHHMAEDMRIFPDLRARQPELGPALDKLTDQHHHIDPILERGDDAFSDLTHPARAAAVLADLKKLLDEHLTFEEAEITPALRSLNEFPTPPDDQAATMYAGGFAWSMQGIKPSIVEKVITLLSQSIVSKLPEARKAFEEKSQRVWGEYAVTSSTTAAPENYKS